MKIEITIEIENHVINRLFMLLSIPETPRYNLKNAINPNHPVTGLPIKQSREGCLNSLINIAEGGKNAGGLTGHATICHILKCQAITYTVSNSKLRSPPETRVSLYPSINAAIKPHFFCKSKKLIQFY